MTVYLICASSGEYSDRQEWRVKAFADEEAAKQFVTACSEEASRIAALKRDEDEAWEAVWLDEKKDERFVHKYDHNADANSLNYDTRYWYEPVELAAQPGESAKEGQPR